MSITNKIFSVKVLTENGSKKISKQAPLFFTFKPRSEKCKKIFNAVRIGSSSLVVLITGINLWEKRITKKIFSKDDSGNLESQLKPKDQEVEFQIDVPCDAGLLQVEESLVEQDSVTVVEPSSGSDVEIKLENPPAEEENGHNDNSLNPANSDLPDWPDLPLPPSSPPTIRPRSNSWTGSSIRSSNSDVAAGVTKVDMSCVNTEYYSEFCSDLLNLLQKKKDVILIPEALIKKYKSFWKKSFNYVGFVNCILSSTDVPVDLKNQFFLCLKSFLIIKLGEREVLRIGSDKFNQHDALFLRYKLVIETLCDNKNPFLSSPKFLSIYVNLAYGQINQTNTFYRFLISLKNELDSNECDFGEIINNLVSSEYLQISQINPNAPQISPRRL